MRNLEESDRRFGKIERQRLRKGRNCLARDRVRVWTWDLFFLGFRISLKGIRKSQKRGNTGVEVEDSSLEIRLDSEREAMRERERRRRKEDERTE